MVRNNARGINGALANSRHLWSIAIPCGNGPRRVRVSPLSLPVSSPISSFHYVRSRSSLKPPTPRFHQPPINLRIIGQTHVRNDDSTVRIYFLDYESIARIQPYVLPWIPPIDRLNVSTRYICHRNMIITRTRDCKLVSFAYRGEISFHSSTRTVWRALENHKCCFLSAFHSLVLSNRSLTSSALVLINSTFLHPSSSSRTESVRWIRDSLISSSSRRPSIALFKVQKSAMRSFTICQCFPSTPGHVVLVVDRLT